LHDSGVEYQGIRVLIVDDHQVVADGLAALLDDQPDIKVVGSTGTVTGAISSAEELSPDVVILDLRLSDGTAADAAFGIRQVRKDARLIFLTRDDSEAAHFMALEAAASAFIHKSRAAAEVIDAVRKVAAGETLIAPTSVATTLRHRRESDSQREALTPRETDVLRLIAEGVSSREIASRLSISYATVRAHTRNVCRKLTVHTKLQAVIKARELAIID
jgi:two-component system nitrate/nitrite response regulator NarL